MSAHANRWVSGHRSDQRGGAGGRLSKEAQPKLTKTAKAGLSGGDGRLLREMGVQVQRAKEAIVVSDEKKPDG